MTRPTDRRLWPGDEFERHRPHLRGVAYRLLGSITEADEAVQETWLRLDRSDPGGRIPVGMGSGRPRNLARHDGSGTIRLPFTGGWDGRGSEAEHC